MSGRERAAQIPYGKVAVRPVVLGLTLALLPGCPAVLVGAGAGGGVGTYAYLKGELQREYAAPFDRTWAATLQALKALEIPVLRTEKDQLGGTVEAQRADGTAVKVAVEPKGSDHALVKIRVGTFGDKDSSERIEKEIAKRL